MYRRILVPIDLAHRDKLEKATKTAADLAKHYEASVVYFGLTSSAPTEAAHTPEDYKEAVEQFARSEGETHGISTSGKVVISHDPSIELNGAILTAADEASADLIVMATHIPGVPDHFFSAHGSKVATKASISVMLVR
ncbi:universal stress protein [Fulvimarina sp. MAC3]|uniref:universal stress protein n=1 Tax=Fulvimarina sp. MAC3 TaxID=3148887 RepID=UPI0031FDF19D